MRPIPSFFQPLVSFMCIFLMRILCGVSCAFCFLSLHSLRFPSLILLTRSRSTMRTPHDIRMRSINLFCSLALLLAASVFSIKTKIHYPFKIQIKIVNLCGIIIQVEKQCTCCTSEVFSSIFKD